MSAASPKLRMKGDQAPPTQGQQVWRMLALMLAITHLIAASVALVVVVGVRWLGRGRVRGWMVLVCGLATTVVGLLMGSGRAYVGAWRQVGAALVNGVRSHASPLEILRPHLMDWALAQAPFSVGVALIIAGAYLMVRDRYTAHWRRRESTPATEAGARAIATAKTKQMRAISTQTPVARVGDLEIPIGIDAHSASPVSIRADELRTHGIVIGPTGVGKTQALERIAYGFTAAPAARRLRLPLVVIDMKADPGLRTYLQAIAKESGRRCHVITTKASTSTSRYNPAGRLDGDELADAVYEVTFADDDSANLHYATLSRRLLQVAAHALTDLAATRARKSGAGRAWEVSLPDLVDLMSLDDLRANSPQLSAENAARVSRYLADVEANGNEKDVGDVRDRLAIITDTAAGRVLAAGGMTLDDAIRSGDIVCFSLDAAGSPETARTIGRLAIQDLIATFARLAATGWGADRMCPILLDEFGALGTPRVADLYARVRSAGGAVILVTQDLDGDLEAVSPQFAAAVRTNANVWLILRQTRGEVAEGIASDIGSRAAWKETVQVQDDWDLLGGVHAASGVGSLREVEEFILHPNQIKSLPQGGAYLLVKVPAGTLNEGRADTRIQRIHITAPAPTTTLPAPQRTQVQQPAVRERPQTHATTNFNERQVHDVDAPAAWPAPPPDLD
ncbi:MAG: type IV secretion system DNA-binding domain-containing protein [Schaalia hyovaginalis]|uniref:type IV secretory system conjugative DNA transfer family protein n=1 Tax=Schaalia hyovaginalis TaxID=29316 RepID=UPI002A9152FA|nr:type IV secretion system DNA-binding domain-containing protein [Schaalia hyovaginalis]MDY6213511.1 type IV secretion system DNA-binding domain-containing protein [Schaalia hyovaginalis]